MSTSGLIELRAGDYSLALEPKRGASVARFDWRGQPLFRPTCGPAITDAGCFPLVPFSNRIAHGVFETAGRTIRLAPNLPDSDHPHPLHGFGWLSAWDVAEHSADRAVLRHVHAAGEWPWHYVAEQTFALSPQGLSITLSVTNLSEAPMPAGLGLHPYFPRDAQTRYLGLHRGEWQTSNEGLPQVLTMADRPIDWWHGQPVGSRAVDTVYTDRDGPLTVTWPGRNLGLTITPGDNLPLTVVYTPRDADFACIEPVSHATDALNRPDSDHPLEWLRHDEEFSVHAGFQAFELTA